MFISASTHSSTPAPSLAPVLTPTSSSALTLSSPFAPIHILSDFDDTLLAIEKTGEIRYLKHVIDYQQEIIKTYNASFSILTARQDPNQWLQPFLKKYQTLLAKKHELLNPENIFGISTIDKFVEKKDSLELQLQEIINQIKELCIASLKFAINNEGLNEEFQQFSLCENEFDQLIYFVEKNECLSSFVLDEIINSKKDVEQFQKEYLDILVEKNLKSMNFEYWKEIIYTNFNESRVRKSRYIEEKLQENPETFFIFFDDNEDESGPALELEQQYSNFVVIKIDAQGNICDKDISAFDTRYQEFCPDEEYEEDQDEKIKANLDSVVFSNFNNTFSLNYSANSNSFFSNYSVPGTSNASKKQKQSDKPFSFQLADGKKQKSS